MASMRSPCFSPLKCAGVPSLGVLMMSLTLGPMPTFLVPRRWKRLPSLAMKSLFSDSCSPSLSTLKLMCGPLLKMMSSDVESRFPLNPLVGVPLTSRILSPSLNPAFSAGIPLAR